MTERGRIALHRAADHLAIGPSALRFDGTSLEIDIDEVTVPWPTRLRGRVRIGFDAMTDQSFRLDAEGLHKWWPIAPCARIEVALERPALRWSGHAYLDTNWGAAPLEQSFRHWNWSRATDSSGTTVLYDVIARDGGVSSLSLRIGRDGGIGHTGPFATARLPTTLWRLPRATRADAGAAVSVMRTLEDAPFYARSLLATRLDGEPATAVHESLSLDRFNARWVQTLLPFRMPRRPS